MGGDSLWISRYFKIISGVAKICTNGEQRIKLHNVGSYSDSDYYRMQTLSDYYHIKSSQTNLKML